MADYADERGRCFPGQAKLAERACIDVRSVRRHIADLERQGLIHVERSRDPATRQWRGNRYHLRFLEVEPEDTVSGGQPEDSHRTPVSSYPSGVNPQGSKNTLRNDARAHAGNTPPTSRPEWQRHLLDLGMPKALVLNPKSQKALDKWIDLVATPEEVQEALRLAHARDPAATIFPAYLTPILRELRETRP